MMRFLLLYCLSACLIQSFGGKTLYVHDFQEAIDSASVIEADSNYFKRLKAYQANLDDHEDFLKESHGRRLKRAALRQPTKSQYQVHDSHNQMLVHWAGEGSDVIVVLSRDIRETNSSTVGLYVSNDYGKTWVNKSASIRGYIIEHFHNNKAAKSHYILTDPIQKKLIISRDYCQHFSTVPLLFAPRKVKMHSKLPRLILAMDDVTDDTKTLYLSRNFGNSWDVFDTGVRSFFWGEGHTVYIQRISSYNTSLSNIIKHSLFNTYRTELITGVLDFEYTPKYMFASKGRPHSGNGLTTMDLYISVNNLPFRNSSFDHHLNQWEYHVVDSSEDQIFVVIVHPILGSNGRPDGKRRIANLYTADKRDLKFVKSLENIVYYNSKRIPPGLEWMADLTNESFVDIHRVEGVHGIYIASVYKDTIDMTVTNLQTVVTYDLGGFWHAITPPYRDENGKHIHCHSYQNCSLQLSQRLNVYYASRRLSPILSKKSAPGLMMATGVRSTTIKLDKPSLFVSNDAGVNWRDVAKGLYSFAFADHGGILVRVLNSIPTQYLHYSLNEGRTWTMYKFVTVPINIIGLLTEPGEKSTVFSLFGSDIRLHSWVIIQIDFNSVFSHACNDEDYRDWSPTDDGIHRCLLGKKYVYKRRLTNTVCLNTYNFDRGIVASNCSCSRYDYECDYGFVRSDIHNFNDYHSFHHHGRKRHTCVRDTNNTAGRTGTDIHKPPAYCPVGGTWTRTKGYRRVAGDSCVADASTTFEPTTLACPLPDEQEFMLYSTENGIYQYTFVGNKSDMLTYTHSTPMVIDFDKKSKCLFWAESTTIKKLCLNRNSNFVGQTKTIVSEQLNFISGLAVDWLGRNLFWIDRASGSIDVANLTGGYRTNVVSNASLSEAARSLVVSPNVGYMAWLENKHIKYCRMNGTGVHTIHEHGAVRSPRALTFDPSEDVLYWTDHSLQHIASFNVHSRTTRTVVNLGYGWDPDGLSIYKDDIYFSDRTKMGIYKVSKYASADNHQPINIVIRTRGIPYDIKIMHFEKQQGEHTCGLANGNCSELCVPSGTNERSCMCEYDYRLRSGSQTVCVLNSVFQCPADKFTCVSNKRCISSSWICDGDDDCEDASDEQNCTSSCSPYQFRCDNGKCKPASYKCDGMDDCGDNSDEEGCFDCKDQFKCMQSSKCINIDSVCDLVNDCHDLDGGLYGSDEADPNGNICTYNNTATPSSDVIGCLKASDPAGSNYRGGQNVTRLNLPCVPWNDPSITPNRRNPYWHSQHQRLLSEISTLDGNNSHSFCRNVDQWHSAEPWCYVARSRSNSTHSSVRVGSCAIPSCNNTIVCPTGLFSCVTRNYRDSCLPNIFRCDGSSDCMSGSDEANCKATDYCSSTNRSRCVSSGKCFFNFERCDGIRQCDDGTDETACTTSTTIGSLTTTSRRTLIGIPCFFLPLNKRPEFFECANGDLCFPLGRKCDGIYDCQDRSDEARCSNTCPPSRSFRCDNGMCATRCNFVRECFDGSDEYGCQLTTPSLFKPCTSAEFRCDAMSCIPSNWVCDGTPDCHGGEDEKLARCSVRNCKYPKFSCRNGFCVNKDEVCNGLDECGDNSDEAYCPGTHVVSLTTAAPARCTKGVLTCDFGRKCYPPYQKCDGKIDCHDDYSDEMGSCTVPKSDVYLSLLYSLPTRCTIRTQLLPSHVQSRSTAFIGYSWTENGALHYDETKRFNPISTHQYNVSGLSPLTKYEMVFSVETNGIIAARSRPIHCTTLPASEFLTDAPKLLNATFTPPGNLALIFKPPTKRNGPIESYSVLVMRGAERVLQAPLRWSKKGSKIYANVWIDAPPSCDTFTVKVGVQTANTRYDNVTYSKKAINVKYNNIRVHFKLNPTKSSVTLSYTLEGKVASGLKDSLDIYANTSLACRGAGQSFVYRHEHHKVKEISGGTIQVKKLISMERYLVSMQLLCNNIRGPVAQQYFFTKAEKGQQEMPALKVLDEGTDPPTISVSWDVSKLDISKGWPEYTVYYDVDQKYLDDCYIHSDHNSLHTKYKSVTTRLDSVVVSNLEFCTFYCFAAKITKPYVGSLSKPPKCIHTSEAIIPTPRAVRHTVNTTHVNITWHSRCDNARPPEQEEKFMLNIAEEDVTGVANKEFNWKTTSSAIVTREVISSELVVSQTFNYGGSDGLKRGQYYAVRVASLRSLKKTGRRWSTTYIFRVPGLKAPEGLLVVISNIKSTFEWVWPDERIYSKQKVRYEVWLNPNCNGSIGPNHPPSLALSQSIKEPPFELSQAVVGMIGVRVSVDGEYSDFAIEPRCLESHFAMAASTNGSVKKSTLTIVAGVGGGVVFILLLGIAIYFIKYRRLARSFAAYASSRYDPQSGVVISSGEANELGEEEGSPMIRGFSDDEPLLMAE